MFYYLYVVLFYVVFKHIDCGLFAFSHHYLFLELEEIVFSLCCCKMENHPRTNTEVVCFGSLFVCLFVYPVHYADDLCVKSSAWSYFTLTCPEAATGPNERSDTDEAPLLTSLLRSGSLKHNLLV